MNPMEQHIKVVAILHIILGILGALVGIVVLMGLLGAGLLSGDRDAALATGTCGMVLGGFLMVISLPSIIAGVGLQKRKQWARILTIILAILNILNFPIGTAIGAYSLWVLLNDQVKGYFV
jgi:hypothetical protein